MEILQNDSLYRKLRSDHYSRFVYDSYTSSFSGNTLDVSFRFILVGKDGSGDIEFNPSSSIVLPSGEWSQDKPAELANLIFHIGMAELISYWKIACASEVEIRPFKLSEEQIAWWKDLYFGGMQEFFYVNSIKDATVENFMNLTSTGNEVAAKFEYAGRDKNLIPVGGGKDSVVTLDLLKTLGGETAGIIINPRGASLETFHAAGFGDRDLVMINRRLHPEMLRLNKEGFPNSLAALNGHTPFSAALAFYSLLAAYGSGSTNIVLSNESSANESTVIGTIVNHQYSKSFEFEENFRGYVRQYISDGLNYYSFLRPVNELQIASVFASRPAYHKVFRSCNVGSKQNIWCNKCPKCLFTYIILSPFLEPEKVAAIFGKDLFADANLLPIFKELIGEAETKPFECVGTIEDVTVALSMSIERFYQGRELPYLLQFYKDNYSYDTHYKAKALFLLEDWNEENNLSKEYSDYLQQAIKTINQPLLTKVICSRDNITPHSKA